MQDAEPREGGLLHPLPLHGRRRAQLLQPGLPHLHRLPARTEGVDVGPAGQAGHVHDGGASRDRRL